MSKTEEARKNKINLQITPHPLQGWVMQCEIRGDLWLARTTHDKSFNFNIAVRQMTWGVGDPYTWLDNKDKEVIWSYAAAASYIKLNGVKKRYEKR